MIGSLTLRAPGWSRTLAFLALAGCMSSGGSPTTMAGGGGGSTGGDMPPALDAITEADLRRDIFILGGDGMRGREAGTLDEMRASVWVAERAREAGLEPAGDDGTYFQWWHMRRTVLAENSRIAAGDSALAFRREVMVGAQANLTLDLPLVWVDNPAGSAAQDLVGRAAATLVRTTAEVTAATTALRARGAGAILLVGEGEADTDAAWSVIAQALRGQYAVDTGQTVAPTGGGGRGGGQANATAPVIRARNRALSRVRSAAARGLRLATNVYVTSYTYPSVNIVGRVRGTDPARRDEYVLFSAHQDHDGVRSIVNGDSIWNGADDNATVSVALLAIGRAVSKRPMARSALFVWHGAEERGLLGSRYFVHKPMVPLRQIVAVLNGDMIGRNHPDSAALSGWRPPYRNSKALAQAALDANTNVSKFKLDTLWDLPSHCEGWYFRSDHLPYAQAGVPALFFSTLLHGDYHRVEDEPRNIDITKLTRVTKWMYATGWTVGNARIRPDVDPGFQAVRGGGRGAGCVQWQRPAMSPPDSGR